MQAVEWLNLWSLCLRNGKACTDELVLFVRSHGGEIHWEAPDVGLRKESADFAEAVAKIITYYRTDKEPAFSHNLERLAAALRDGDPFKPRLASLNGQTQRLHSDHYRGLGDMSAEPALRSAARMRDTFSILRDFLSDTGLSADRLETRVLSPAAWSNVRRQIESKEDVWESHVVAQLEDLAMPKEARSAQLILDLGRAIRKQALVKCRPSPPPDRSPPASTFAP